MDRLTAFQKFADKINADRNPWTAEDVARTVEELALESVRSEALAQGDKLMQAKLSGFNDGLEEAAGVCDLYAHAERSADDTSAGMWNAGPYVKCALAIRALSPARVAEEKDVHDNELRK